MMAGQLATNMHANDRGGPAWCRWDGGRGPFPGKAARAAKSSLILACRLVARTSGSWGLIELVEMYKCLLGRYTEKVHGPGPGVRKGQSLLTTFSSTNDTNPNVQEPSKDRHLCSSVLCQSSKMITLPLLPKLQRPCSALDMNPSGSPFTTLPHSGTSNSKDLGCPLQLGKVSQERDHVLAFCHGWLCWHGWFASMHLPGDVFALAEGGFASAEG